MLLPFSQFCTAQIYIHIMAHIFTPVQAHICRQTYVHTCIYTHVYIRTRRPSCAPQLINTWHKTTCVAGRCRGSMLLGVAGSWSFYSVLQCTVYHNLFTCDIITVWCRVLCATTHLHVTWLHARCRVLQGVAVVTVCCSVLCATTHVHVHVTWYLMRYRALQCVEVGCSVLCAEEHVLP